MTNRDEISKDVDELLAGWFNGEGHDVDRKDIIELVMKHSAVAAEPFGWIKPGAATNDEKYDYGMFAYRQQEDTPVAIYTAPPAPSVVVKALASEIKKLEVSYHVGECMGLADWAAFEAGITKGLEAAAEKVSTLYSQVHDVATAAEFADRMFTLHGFMLCERHNGKHAVTVTFPNLAEAQQFHGALVDLSRHTTAAAPAKQETTVE